MKRTTQVIGHRGNKAKYTENTLKGFESVFNNTSLDGIELDVVVSKDRKLFISHDMYMMSSKKRIWFHEIEYKQVLEIASSYHDSELGIYPLLEEVFKLYHINRPNQKIQIEVKSLPEIDLPLSIEDVITYIHGLIHKYDIQDRVVITSFDFRYLVESKNQNQSIKTGLILHRCLLPLTSLLTLPVNALIFEKSWVLQNDIPKIKDLGMEVYVWTANSKTDWTRLCNIGVTGIITDQPQELVNWLQE